MYVKLFASILDSSVWDESPETRLVWITMLLMADEHGFVRGTTNSVARRAVVSVDGAVRALEVLSSADAGSHTTDHEGRRIESVDGGWLVLNYAKYREMRTRTQVKQAEKKRRQRGRDDAEGGTCPPVSPSVPSVSPSVPTIAYAYASASVSPEETEKQETRETLHAAEFAECWAAYPKRAGGNSRALALKAWTARRKDGATPADLLAGTQRYAAFVRATGKEGTEYVKQGATFYGPGEHYLETWDAPSVSVVPIETERDRQRRRVLEIAAMEREQGVAS